MNTENAPGSESYRVSLTKDYLVFSAAHFITFSGDICERLHGHNYGVRCDVWGPLDENHYVVDFIALRDTLKELVARLDHHVLLPQHHPQIRVTQEAHEVTARFEQRRWVFPSEDCVILPVANTTVGTSSPLPGTEVAGAVARRPTADSDRIGRG